MTARTLSLAILLALAAGPARAASPACGDEFSDDTATRFFGNAGRQVLTLTYDGSGDGVAQLDCTGDGRLDGPGDLSDTFFNAANVDLKGNDTITVMLTANWTNLHKKLAVLLGPGANSVTLDFGSVTLSNSSFDVEIVGGTGADSVTIVNAPLLFQSAVSVRANLGAGNDVVTAALPRTFGNSQYDLDLDLGAGANRVVIDQGGALVLGGVVQVNVTGGTGSDVVTATIDGHWSGNSRLLLGGDLGAGNDTATVSLVPGGTDGFAVDAGSVVWLRFAGGAGADKMGVSVASGAPAVVNGELDVTLAGGAGNDALAATLPLDLSGGILRLRADGGADNDSVTVDVDSSTSSAPPRHDVLVSGGAGNDLVTFDQSSVAGAVLLSVLDGGPGTADKCSTAGNAPPHLRGCELMR